MSSKGRGRAQRFLAEVVMPYEGDDCLLWPYRRETSGYARMGHEGRMVLVSRLICARVYGPPPSEDHHAAHSCGRGHEGCVTKRHVSWKTPKENAVDKAVHGTEVKGSKHYLSRLSNDDVAAIRLAAGRVTQQSLAHKFGVSRTVIGNIMSRKSYRL